MLTVGLNLKPRVKKGFDSDAQAFFTRVTVAGGTLSATEKLATNQLVLDMKSAGIWSSMKAIYPMVGASAAACAQNLKSSSFTGTFTSGWTFASTGVTPNGTSAFMDTFCTPSANLLQNNTHISYYSRTNNAGTANVEMGVAGSNALFITPNYAIGSSYRAVNSGQIGPLATNTNTAAFFQASRIDGTTAILYRNNSAIFTDAINSTGLSTLNIYVGCYNSSGSPLYYTNRECAYASIGQGMTITEQGNYYTAIQTFQTTLSRAVGPQLVSDADAQAYIYRVYAAGGTLTNTEATAVNQLTIDMKASNVWTSMKAVYPMIGSSAAACAQNLKSSSFTGSFTSGWTFASTGVTPNGTSAYMDTALNASTQLTQNNASFSIYNRTNSDGTRCDIGCTDSIAATRLITIYSRQTNVINADINSTASRISVANTNSTGFYLTRRTANNIFKLNKNSVNIGNNTTTDNTVMPNFNIYLGGIPFFSQFSNRENAFASIGDGLTDTQASDFYTNVQTFNTTLSRQV